MAVIDPRLIDCDGEPEITENLNRILSLLDGLESRVESLEQPEPAE